MYQSSDPLFFIKSFIDTANSQTSDLAQILDLTHEAKTSLLFDISGLQDSFSFRKERRAYLIAKYLLAEERGLEHKRLDNLIYLLEQEGYILYPEGLSDAIWTEHALQTARAFKDNPSLFSLIKSFKLPLCDAAAETLVRFSLSLFAKEPLTHLLLQQSILSACFSLLRQSVGSCFATAPAILIQREQLEHFLKDLQELLYTGKLSRTFEGVELAAPLSPSTGGGDLYKKTTTFSAPGILRALEVAGVPIPKKDPKAPISVKDLLHQTLLSHFSLKEADLMSYEAIEASLVKSEGFGASLTGHLSPAKIAHVRQFLEKKEIAEAAFKGLVDHPLVKAWEYTLASFSEMKSAFNQWNLYPSLGLHPDEKGGIGEAAHIALQRRLDLLNEKIVEYQAAYEAAFHEARSVETLLEQASSDSEMRRIRAEYSSKMHHMQSYKDMRDDAHKEASACASFYSYLVEEYIKYFPIYFQEIYDANMQDVQDTIYEDSPAGFRLVYKYGRSKTSVWSLIYTAKQYITALCDFFSTIETVLKHELEDSPNVNLLTEVTSALLALLQTEEFLQTAFLRIAKAHKEAPPKDLEKASKKPWSFTAGGSMSNLLSVYYKKESAVTDEEFWADNTTDLLSAIITHTKNISSTHKEILISSPTHAFILLLDFPLFRKALDTDLFPYSWVRDELIAPRRAFYSALNLSIAEQLFLQEILLKKYPKLSLKSASSALSIQDFRAHLTQYIPSDILDSFLYESLPLTSTLDWKSHVNTLLKGICNPIFDGCIEPSASFMTAKQLKETAKAIYLLSTKSLVASFDVHAHIETKAREHKLSAPSPLLFADTNWNGYFFGFLVNPGTLELELWRLDYLGASGIKMSSWEQFMNGKDTTKWHIFTKPFEYC